MPQKGLIYRVLIASPSDCNEERSSIPKILHDWNASNSYQKSVILEPVMWESHVAPDLSGSPQDIINRMHRMKRAADFTPGDGLVNDAGDVRTVTDVLDVGGEVLIFLLDDVLLIENDLLGRVINEETI